MMNTDKWQPYEINFSQNAMSLMIMSLACIHNETSDKGNVCNLLAL